jgi:DNA recombination protein RmuC
MESLQLLVVFVLGAGLGFVVASLLLRKSSNDLMVMASEFATQHSSQLLASNQGGLNHFLQPLEQKFSEFSQAVSQANASSVAQTTKLETHIKSILEVEQGFSAQAGALADALVGNNRFMGEFGETNLRVALEHAGLERGVHYREQETFQAEASEQGRKLRPDFIVNLPDNKVFIIDSKVSVSNYSRYVNADDAEEKTRFAKAHLTSIKTHIRSLSSKNYQRIPGLDTVDFVAMYIPVEPAYLLAIKEDPELLELAIKEKVLLITSSTLLATLKLIRFLWTEKQFSDNAQEISKRGSKLQAQFRGFLEQMNNIKAGLDSANNAYDRALTRLNGQQGLVHQSEQLAQLGVQHDGDLPPQFRVVDGDGDEMHEPGRLRA